MRIFLDKKKFVSLYEAEFGKANAKTKQGIEFFIDKFNVESRLKNLAQFAYVLATTYHESNDWKRGIYFQPVREGRESSSSPRRRNQDRYWFTGYYGRGFPQTTHKENYANAGLILGLGIDYFLKNPDALLIPEYAYEVMVVSMVKGLYRKDARGPKSLDRYLNANQKDFINARDIINGDTKKNGRAIAEHAFKFERILKGSLISKPANPVEVSTLLPEPVAPTETEPAIDIEVNAPEPVATDQGTQAAGVIVNNAPPADSTVPPGFTPQNVTVQAPAPTGVKATLKSWLNWIYASAGGSGVLLILKEYWETGKIDIGALLGALGAFVAANFIIIAALLGVIAVCYFVYEILSMREKQKSFRLEMEFKARPDRNNPTIIPS